MKDFPLISALALVYWGINTGNMAVSLIFAVLLEAAPHLKLRFDFKEKDFNNISMITSFSLAGYVIYYINSAMEISVISGLLMFLPVSLFPLNFFFMYSTSDSVNAKRLFLLFVTNKYSVSNSYIRSFRPDFLFLAALIVGGSVKITEGSIALLYAVAIIILIKYRSPNHTAIRFISSLIFALMIAFLIQTGIYTSFSILKETLTDLYVERFMKFRSGVSNVGSIARLKDSFIIDLRADIYYPHPAGGFLFRERVFNSYFNGTWSDSGTEKAEFMHLHDLYSNELDSVRIYYFSKGRSDLIKMPFGTFDFNGLERDKLVLNKIGSLTYIYTQHLIDYKAYLRKERGSDLFNEPDKTDIRFDMKDSAYADTVIDFLRLKGLSVREIYNRIDRFFRSDYKYSLDYINVEGRLKIDHFISEKKGHCELFATLTALVYRRLDFPARYVTGYLVSEYSGLENKFIARRKDRHAWVLVWDESEGWIELDPTPPDISGYSEKRNIFGKIYDVSSYLYYKFFTFRKENSELFRNLLIYSLIPLGLFLMVRIFKDVKLKDRTANKRSDPYIRTSELDVIEKKLASSGHKPDNIPVGSWLTLLKEKFSAFGNSFDKVRELYYKKRYGMKEMSEDEKKEFSDHSDNFTRLK